ncbi:MAG TPA: ATP-binding protein, partial [Chloroflexota bacterium]|nr:ATP-binding protein [Chloroflexota bacterium]
MAYNGEEARKKLQDFNFKDLFIEVLGWSRPASPRPVSITAAAVVYEYRQIAQLAGVAVLQVTAGDGRIPDAQSREAVHKQIAQTYHENLLIFLDGNDHAGNYTQSLWYWVKRDAGKLYPRHHLYVKGQPGDLLIGKLSAMFFDLSELDQYGKVPVIKAADNLRKALDVSWVTKRFFTDFQKVHEDLLPLIGGIDDERDRRWYASVLLNRLMFIYFLQRKGFLDRGKYDYLLDKLAASKECGTDLYYSRFLRALFFEGFAKPAYQRSAEANALLGEICYLNGGLFLPHPIELRNPRIAIPDRAFDILFALFRAYTWNLDDTPGGQDGELNPDVLGYIFEKYINQKAFGAYYTRTEITEYLCERTIHTLILERVNTPAIPGVHRGHHFESVSDL